MKTPYRHGDKALKRLYTLMEHEFQNFSTVLRFDEMNVMAVKKQVSRMYTRIQRVVKRELAEVAEKAYRDAEDEVKAPHKDFSGLVFLAALFGRYDPVTKYVYTREWVRKRDRLVESLMASRGRQEVRQALRRALDQMGLQVRQYTDNVTDEARFQVFGLAGIEKVMWNTQRDSRVCGVCEERDGEIYKIEDVPPKHYRCRCYLTAV